MKANQKFASADDAVSPVIGVILMVAITVVLAAVVFVLVQDQSDTQDDAPDVQYQREESQDQLKLIQAPGENDVHEFEIRADAAISFAVNAAAAAGTTDLTVNTYDGLDTDDGTTVEGMEAGDFISFCGTAAAFEDVTVTIRHVETNAIIADYTFSTIAQCV